MREGTHAGLPWSMSCSCHALASIGSSSLALDDFAQRVFDGGGRGRTLPEAAMQLWCDELRQHTRRQRGHRRAEQARPAHGRQVGRARGRAAKRCDARALQRAAFARVGMHGRSVRRLLVAQQGAPVERAPTALQCRDGAYVTVNCRPLAGDLVAFGGCFAKRAHARTLEGRGWFGVHVHWAEAREGDISHGLAYGGSPEWLQCGQASV